MHIKLIPFVPPAKKTLVFENSCPNKSDRFESVTRLLVFRYNGETSVIWVSDRTRESLCEVGSLFPL